MLHVWLAVCKLKKKKLFSIKKKNLGGGKFLAKDFGIFLPKGGYTFWPKILTLVCKIEIL
jgi:hypothetical protein